MMLKMIEEEYLDMVLVPTGLLVLGIYHCWLLFTIIKRPSSTVVGVNAISRQQWVYHMMSNQGKNGVLAIQTIRNNLMAATLLATIAITLSSLISAVVSDSNSLVLTIHTTKYLAVLICFLVAFFCNMQTIRYYAHVSFLINVPSTEFDGSQEFVEYVVQQLNRGGMYWSLGLRAFYFSFPLLLWIFGAIAMFACSCLMVFLLYFLDTVSSSPKFLQSANLYKKSHDLDIESAGDSMRSVFPEDSNLRHPLMDNTKLNSASGNNVFTSAR